MQAILNSVFARSDTMLGVCQALGEDFGFNPNLLRIVFGVALLWNPFAVIGIYFGLGVMLMLINLLARALVRGPKQARAAEAAAADEQGVEEDREALAA